MTHFCARFLGKARFCFLLLAFLSISAFGQVGRTPICRENDHACLISEYQKNIFSECQVKSFDCVIARLTKRIESDPNDASAYFLRGRFSFYKKELDQAVRDFNRTLELIPGYKETYNELGVVYIQKEDYDKAIQIYDRAVNLAPKVSYYYSHRGLAYRRKGDFDKALADYDKAIELNPRDDHAYGLRAALYVAFPKDYKKALADYNKAIELVPGNWRNFYARGNFYWLLGEREKSDADLQKAKELKEFEEKGK